MARKKKDTTEIVTFRLEIEQLKQVDRMTARMSLSEGRLLTRSDAIRMAIEQCYPIPSKVKQTELGLFKMIT